MDEKIEAEVKWFAQVHMDSKWWYLDSNTGSLGKDW